MAFVTPLASKVLLQEFRYILDSKDFLLVNGSNYTYPKHELGHMASHVLYTLYLMMHCKYSISRFLSSSLLLNCCLPRLLSSLQI